jgi:hypothetical protein
MSGDIGSSNISFFNIVTAYNNVLDTPLPTTNISLSNFRDATFTDGSSIPSTGAISIFANFRGKTWGPSEPVETKLTASDGAADDFFGWSASISGDGLTAIVGAYGDGGRSNSGSAYIFNYANSTWSQTSKLTASPFASGDFFGFSVSISEDGLTAIVGAYGDDDNGSYSGSAYIFNYANSTWSQTSKLTASDGASGDYFGFSVSISDDGLTAIVGAYRDDSIKGSAYIFNYVNSTWSQTSKLTASGGAAGEYFGYSVSISEDGLTAIVGAQYGDVGGSDSGSAYIFNYANSTWSQTSKLVASDGASSDRFGNSVSISGDGLTAIVGAIFDDVGGSNSGSAYIFNYANSTWSQTSKLTASDGSGTDLFGYSVSISDNGLTAIVGAIFNDDKGSDSGSAYIFKYANSTWSQTSKLVASDGAAGDRFGNSVSIFRRRSDRYYGSIL